MALQLVAHRWFKILRKGLEHQGVQYAYDVSMCVPTGMYFCRREAVPRWLDLYEDNEFVAEVHLLAQSRVEHLSPYKSRVDWFELRNPVPIVKFIRRYFEPMDVLKRSPFLIRYMEKPSMILQFYAIESNPHSLDCIDEQFADVCEFALKRNGLCLRYVNYHSLDLYRVAVAQNGNALAYVEEKYWAEPNYKKGMEEVCLAAVTKTGLALQFVRPEFQTAEICCAAVGQNGYALAYVCPHLKTPEVCRIAWKENSRALTLATAAFQEVAARRKIEIH
jgi:hypothetical protein